MKVHSNPLNRQTRRDIARQYADARALLADCRKAGFLNSCLALRDHITTLHCARAFYLAHPWAFATSYPQRHD